MMSTELGFVHRYLPATQSPADGQMRRTLLLLHGTGGDENDLIGLGQQLDPTANLLSPRGKVLENGMARYFRRFAEGVFDEADVIAQTHELAEFVSAAALHYAFDPGRITVVGYSNGANIAVSLLLLHPDLLAEAVLFRAILPLTTPPQPNLAKCRIFLSEGERDPILNAAQAAQLATHLQQCGAVLTLRWWPVGHGLIPQEFEVAQGWLAANSQGQGS